MKVRVPQTILRCDRQFIWWSNGVYSHHGSLSGVKIKCRTYTVVKRKTQWRRMGGICIAACLFIYIPHIPSHCWLAGNVAHLKVSLPPLHYQLLTYLDGMYKIIPLNCHLFVTYTWRPLACVCSFVSLNVAGEEKKHWWIQYKTSKQLEDRSELDDRNIHNNKAYTLIFSLPFDLSLQLHCNTFKAPSSTKLFLSSK